MNIVTRYPYTEIPRIEENGTRLYDIPSFNPVPSVTTILSDTGDKSAIDEWRKRVGAKEADRITKQSADTGSDMHDNLENYIRDGAKPIGSPMAKMMTRLIIRKGLCQVNEIWGMEEALYIPDLYAGTADLLGVWNGKPAIMDYKNSRSIKRKEWIEDYFLQLCAYAEAHNDMYGTDIKTGAIMMATHDGHYLEFVLEESEYDKYCNKWYDRLSLYYEKIQKENI